MKAGAGVFVAAAKAAVVTVVLTAGLLATANAQTVGAQTAGAEATTGQAADQGAAGPADRTVTLKSFDGSTQLRGTLTGFDGSTFTIDTVLGTLEVDALKVDCEGEACPQNMMFGAAFGIDGSRTIGAKLMPALIQGYADSMDATMVAEIGPDPDALMLRIVHPNGREMAAIDVREEGTAEGFRAMADNDAAIAMASRRARDRDIDLLRPAGIDDLRDTDNEHVLALDGVVAITHPGNPIRSISMDELALIFSGQLTDWSQLGGPPGPVDVYAREDGSGTIEAFAAQVLAPRGLAMAPAVKRFDSDIEVADGVAADPAGIGLTAIAYQRAAKALPIRQACGLLSYPTTFAMKAEEYPLISRLYLYTPPTGMPAHAKQLVDFALSDAAQPLIAETGFVDQRIESRALDQQGARLVHGVAGEEEFSLDLMRGMLRELDDATRLSVTFRFTTGSSELTPKSRLDARKLAEELSRGVYAGRDILLVGFTDSIGKFDLNRWLSVKRAETVEQELRATLPPGALDQAGIVVMGYGELTPVGCNDSLEGRTANRRVEVWIRNRR